MGETAKEYFEGTVTLTASGKWRVIYDRDLQGVKLKLGWQQLHTAKELRDVISVGALEVQADDGVMEVLFSDEEQQGGGSGAKNGDDMHEDNDEDEDQEDEDQ